jgi:hypothetical protein
MKTHKAQRRERAILRNEEYAKLTVIQKIAKLDARLGKNIGAEKQREKLAK